jgi:hypothetical protein
MHSFLKGGKGVSVRKVHLSRKLAFEKQNEFQLSGNAGRAL